MAVKVALVKEKTRQDNIFKALKLISNDLLPFKKAKRVLIKPNFTSAYNPAASTSGDAVEAILDFFKNFDPNFSQKEIIITESSGEAFSRREKIEKILYRFGFKNIFNKYQNVKFWDMNKAKKFILVEIEMIGGKTKIRIPREFFEFDYKISVSIPKTHDTVIFTGGVKNLLMGIIKQEDKGLMHGLVGKNQEKLTFSSKILNWLGGLVLKKAPWQFLVLANNYLPNWLKDKIYGFNKDIFIRSVICLNKNLVKIGRLIMPDLVVLDGWQGMDKDGPVYGRKRKLGVAIASTDGIAADVVGAKIIGFNPEKIPYLKILAEKRKELIFPKNLNVLGEKISKVSQKFIPHRHYSYQISGNQSCLNDLNQ